VLTIEHIGSTAVPGLAAKPIIDLQASVRSLAEAQSRCVEPASGVTTGLADRKLSEDGRFERVLDELKAAQRQGWVVRRYRRPGVARKAQRQNSRLALLSAKRPQINLDMAIAVSGTVKAMV
jgi:hypothetical protein